MEKGSSQKGQLHSLSSVDSSINDLDPHHRALNHVIRSRRIWESHTVLDLIKRSLCHRTSPNVPRAYAYLSWVDSVDLLAGALVGIVWCCCDIGKGPGRYRLSVMAEVIAGGKQV